MGTTRMFSARFALAYLTILALNSISFAQPLDQEHLLVPGTELEAGRDYNYTPSPIRDRTDLVDQLEYVLLNVALYRLEIEYGVNPSDTPIVRSRSAVHSAPSGIGIAIPSFGVARADPDPDPNWPVRRWLAFERGKEVWRVRLDGEFPFKMSQIDDPQFGLRNFPN